MLCNDFAHACKKLGRPNAAVLFTRCNQLNAAADIAPLLQRGVGNIHLLTGTRAGQYSMRLAGGWRLVFVLVSEDNKQIASIQEIVDYH